MVENLKKTLEQSDGRRRPRLWMNSVGTFGQVVFVFLICVSFLMMNFDSTNPFLNQGVNDCSYLLPPPPLFPEVVNIGRNFDFLASTPTMHSPAAAGQQTIVVQSPPSVLTDRTTITHFSGFMHEDGQKFLSEFQSYMALAGLEPSSPRVVAAFHLNLKGPARIWFNNLTDKDSWDVVRTEFEKEYCTLMHSPAMIAETVAFDNMKLTDKQTIEEYHALILDKGKKLGKSETDMTIKFINSLPAQLAFFVRAGRVTSYRDALQSAKIGEAHGYRQEPTAPALYKSASVPEVVAAAAVTSVNRDLQEQVKLLNRRLDDLSTRGGNRPIRDRSERTCYKCSGKDHIKTKCNWNGQGEKEPNTTCQLCHQKGHSAIKCNTLPSRRTNTAQDNSCQLCESQDHMASDCPSLNQRGLGPARTSQA